MITSKKKRKCLLASAGKKLDIKEVNDNLSNQGLGPVNQQEWSLWTTYYLPIINRHPYLEYELIENNRSLRWLNQQINHRKNKFVIS